MGNLDAYVFDCVGGGVVLLVVVVGKVGLVELETEYGGCVSVEEKGRENLGLDSLSLVSTSLAKPIA